MPAAYQPLHHKYRPQRFDQLVGQEAIAATLGNALRSGRIAPAYLFSGPRGTGKPPAPASWRGHSTASAPMDRHRSPAGNASCAPRSRPAMPSM